MSRTTGRTSGSPPTSNSTVQHIASLLAIDGRAAVVVPDNVLFEGVRARRSRRRLLNEYDVHTLLRLPTGIFYAGGVKANVLFFDRKRARPNRPWTDRLWVYDFRTGEHFTLKQRPLRDEHLQSFIDALTPTTVRHESNPNVSRPTPTTTFVARDKVNSTSPGSKTLLTDADDGVPPRSLRRGDRRGPDRSTRRVHRSGRRWQPGLRRWRPHRTFTFR